MSTTALRALSFAVAVALSACGGGDPADAGTRVLCASCGAGAGSGTPPSPPVVAQSGSAEGYWNGIAAPYTFATVVLPDGTTYAAYIRSGLIEGVTVGRVTSSGGTITGKLTDYNGPLRAVTPATVSGTYVARQSLNLSLRAGSLAYSLQAAYDPSYDTEANLSDFAGTWSGTAVSRDGVGPFSLTLAANGDITGVAQACRFSGLAMPIARGKHPLRLDLSFSGAGCPAAGRSVSGIAVTSQSGSRQQLLVTGVLADGSDGFFGLAGR